MCNIKDKLVSNSSVKPENDKICQEIEWHDGATCKSCENYVFCPERIWPDLCNHTGELLECYPDEAVSCHGFKEVK